MQLPLFFFGVFSWQVPNSVSGPSSNLLKDKIHASTTKRNTLRHNVLQKQNRLQDLQKKLRDLDLEEKAQSQDKVGGTAEVQRLRTLENSLDKANIKAQEAQHIGRTYHEIIQKLQQDRLQFDATITKLETTLEHRRQELSELEVCSPPTPFFLGSCPSSRSLRASHCKLYPRCSTNTIGHVCRCLPSARSGASGAGSQRNRPD